MSSPPVAPSSEQETLLEVLVGAEERSRAAWASWREDHRPGQAWPPPEERLIPLLLRRLQRLELAIDDWEPLLTEAYRRTWSQNQALRLEALAAASGLRSAGIPVALLKGIALQVEATTPGSEIPPAGGRSMADADLLVRPEQAAAAYEVLAAGGWVPVAEDPRLVLRGNYHASFSRNPAVPIELHWYSLGQPSSDGGLWERAREVDLGGTPAWLPARSDQLLVSCVHGFGERSHGLLIWVVDALGLIGNGDAIDWETLCAEAESRQVSSFLHPMLAYLSERWDAPVPEQALERLCTVEPTRLERAGRRAKLATPGPLTALRTARTRYRRLRSLDREGLPRPTYMATLRSVWGPRPRRRMLADAAASLGRTLTRRPG